MRSMEVQVKPSVCCTAGDFGRPLLWSRPTSPFNTPPRDHSVELPWDELIAAMADVLVEQVAPITTRAGIPLPMVRAAAHRRTTEVEMKLFQLHRNQQ